jgi:hypothetical protein
MRIPALPGQPESLRSRLIGLKGMVKGTTGHTDFFDYAEVDTQLGAKREGCPLDNIEAFSNEEEATEFVTRLSKNSIDN